MAHKHQWTRYDAERLGLVVLEALANLGRDGYGTVDLDLDGRWIRICLDDLEGQVVLLEIETPPELRDRREEG